MPGAVKGCTCSTVELGFWSWNPEASAPEGLRTRSVENAGVR